MKKSILVCLLAMSAVGMAQTTAPTAKEAAKMEADAAKQAAKLDADEAKVRADLEAARARLDKAAREVAELSTQLGRSERHVWVMRDGGPGERSRAVLGVQIDPESSKEGARVERVSPGGAAEEAGMLEGDVIVALDGKSMAGTPNPGRSVVEFMRQVKPEQKVKVKVLRGGKNKDLVVVARPMAFAGNRIFNVEVPEFGSAVAGSFGNMPHIRQFRHIFPGEFGGMELASITPKLGAYFGVTEGVLVVQAPDNAAFKLEDGDVIQTIDGRKPDDGAHAMRILRSYQSGEKLNLGVLRQRKTLTLAVTMPERPEIDDHFMVPPVPPIGPVPPVPPVPPTPGIPGGAGT